MSFGFPGELGVPAMAMPRPMQMRTMRTMPARRAAGPCQSMAGKPNQHEFFSRGSISRPTVPARMGADSNGPVTPYKPARSGRKDCSNTDSNTPRDP